MAENQIEVQAPPEQVWAVLAEPQTYDEWVVGAQAVRDADSTWPQAGSKLHHRTGVGPLTIDDETMVELADAPTKLVLLAKVRPAGDFRVTLELRATPAGTTVVMHEEPVGGVATVVPGTDAAIAARNSFSLRRLKALAEGTSADDR